MRFLLAGSPRFSSVRSMIAPARELLDAFCDTGDGTCMLRDEGGREVDGPAWPGWTPAEVGLLETGEPAKVRPVKLLSGDADAGL